MLKKNEGILVYALKICLTLYFSLIVASEAICRPIDSTKAVLVAYNFIASSTSRSDVSSTDFKLVLAEKGVMMKHQFHEFTYFYIFGIKDLGFVVVSGDDVLFPILAYSNKNNFDPIKIPTNTAKWLESYKLEIRYAIENGVNATDEIQLQWENLLGSAPSITLNGNQFRSVSPLVQTTWDQSPFYNDLCPGGSVTGCVATAMAQILKYWNYPANGTGFYDYIHSSFGTLSANYGATTYQWNLMPNVVNATNISVATLMYHCGVSVDMDYSPSGSGAAGAVKVAPALKNYFGYPASVAVKLRSNFTNAQWMTLLKQELDAGRPMYYEGAGNGSGHAFVCDGYDNNNLFHFNWGWSGLADGNYSLNALNPTQLGTGSGLGSYNYNQKIVSGIQPPSSAPTYNLRLYRNVSPSSSPLAYGNSFTVTTNIVNSGTNSFSGDYCAAVFDNNYSFVDYVEIKSGYSLQAGNIYSNDLIFSNSGLFSMLPGSYYIGIFYRPTGGNWVMVSNNGPNSNLIQLTVVNPNSIQLNSQIVLTPGSTLTKGQPASANLNIKNTGTSTFIGQYQLNLYKLDGSFVQTINTISENNGLPAGYTYQSPYLTFSTSSVNADPGSYLLAAVHKPVNSGTWQLTGSNTFQNPVRVIVKLPEFVADQYEVNNSISQAYNLPVNFNGSSANVNTSGSNIHISSDYDYYKLDLPSGFNYILSARLHDSYNSANGINYSVDALFSYSTDGLTWSEAYDDVMGSNISLSGGTSIYFHVASYFAGQKGTYLLDLNLTRNIITSTTSPLMTSNIKIYPNPSNNHVVLDASARNMKIKDISLFSTDGVLIRNIENVPFRNKITISLGDLPSGLYLIKYRIGEMIETKKIIIHR